MAMQFEQVYRPTTLRDAVALLQRDPHARPIAGATDVVVELSHTPTAPVSLVDLTAIEGLRYVRYESGQLRIGALTTHADLMADREVIQHAFALAQAAAEVGAPQIRNRATLVGNLVTASPANDTITALTALGAEIIIVGPAGERMVPIDEFYRGFRATVLQPAELVREVRLQLRRERSTFVKLGLRRAQAIAVINLALAWHMTDDGRIEGACVALGAVGPTILRSSSAEDLLDGRRVGEVDPAAVARATVDTARPIDDVRAPARYRRAALEGVTARAVRALLHDDVQTAWPQQPVLLRSPEPTAPPQLPSAAEETVSALVNGEPMRLDRRLTLLDALRAIGLTGTKEGCGEGECGACTVWLNGAAVMACLTPAAQAEQGTVRTIEGLAPAPAALHELQQAFIAHGAVQCGYCIPGILMAGARLLDEIADPTVEQIQVALSGNLCRCTGYRKIIEAVQAAAAARRSPEFNRLRVD